MAACASLACDACPKPGRCCVGFTLSSERIDAAETPLEAMAHVASVTTGMVLGQAIGRWNGAIADADVEHLQLGLPFLPLFRDSIGRWRWWCPRLTREGRCGDYESRPALCRTYQAGEDTLCAMHRPRKPEPVEVATP